MPAITRKQSSNISGSGSQDSRKTEDADDGCSDNEEIISSQSLSIDEDGKAGKPLPTCLPCPKVILCTSSMKLDKYVLMDLPHPGTENTAKFLISSDDGSIYELLKHDETHSAWFIDDSVAHDGGFYVSLPVHKVFLILPFVLKNARTKFVTFDQVIDGAPQELKQLPGLNDQLLKISDNKDVCGETVYRYSETKLIEWLKIRMERVATALKECDGSADDLKLSNLAYGIISDYLPFSIKAEMRTKLQIPDLPKAQESSAATKRKATDDEPCENYYKEELAIELKKAQSESKLTTTQKKLQKASIGSKSLSAYFTKK